MMMTLAIDAQPGPGSPLSGLERAALRAACDTFFPELEGRAGSAGVRGNGALALGVPERVEETIGILSAAEQGRLRLFLRLLERPAAMLLFLRRAQRFSELSPSERERMLLRMSTSAIPQLRTGFQALCRLSAFHQYSTMPAGADNPLWVKVGYRPTTNPPPVKSALRIERVSGSMRLDCDVCVIGSGAGGSVIAAELAARGRKVIVLEAGSDWQSEDFDQHEATGTRELYLDRGTSATRDLGVAFLAGSSLGGGTTVNWQSCFRTPPAVLEEWAERSGCAHFTAESFSRSLDSVWARLSVSRDESEVNANNAILERGCAVLGYRWDKIARNSAGCDTAQCGYCVYGCRHGGKQTAGATFLRDAWVTGNVSVIARCRADRVLIANRRVQGVLGFVTDPASETRHSVRIDSGIAVAACGALNTPALLMRSGVEARELGRNLSIHPTTAMTGLFADRVETWSGPPQTIVCDEFSSLRGNYGYRIETAPAHPGLLAMATPWIGADNHRRLMAEAARRGVLIILSRDRPLGRVTIDREGRPRIQYVPGKAERDLILHGMASSARILAAAEAEEIQSLHVKPAVLNLRGTRQSERAQAIDSFCAAILSSSVGANRLQLFSAHQMGTCRMGREPRNAVCAEDGAVFGVRGLYIGDASAFPASSGVNPMITIMAMAHHTAQRISDNP